MWQRRAFLQAAGTGFAASLLPQRAAALGAALRQEDGLTAAVAAVVQHLARAPIPR